MNHLPPRSLNPVMIIPRSPLTPHIVEPKDDSLTGSSAGGTSTSNSGGKVLHPYLRSSRGKVIPHYLRASTGSCHDVCKYGGHHAFAAKEKHPISKGRKNILKEDQSPIESISPETRKKTFMVKLASSCDLGIQSCDIPETKKQETIKQSSVSPTNKIKDGFRSSVAFKSNSVTKKLSSSPLSSPRDHSLIRSTDVKTGKKSDSPKSEQRKDPVSKTGIEKCPASPLNPARDRNVRKYTDVKTGKKSDSSKTFQKNDLVSKHVTENSPPSPFSSPRDRRVRRDSNVQCYYFYASVSRF